MESWALMWRPSPWRTGEQVKVVWKSTGTGDLRIFAVSPSGREVLPLTGPTPHFGSTWDRPGDEWGTSFELDETRRVDVEGGARAGSGVSTADRHLLRPQNTYKIVSVSGC